MALLAPGPESIPFSPRRRFSVYLGLIILFLVVHPNRLHSTPNEPDPDGEGKAATADLPTGARGGFPVGYRVLEIEVPDRQGRTTTIPIAVWYPTVDRERKHKYQVGKKTVATRIAVNGEPFPGPFPLILFSHGAGGSGLGAAFLTESLAALGYVVAAPDYTDRYFIARIDGPVSRPSWWRMWEMGKWFRDLRDYQLNEAGKASRKNFAYRFRQATAVLDRLLAANRDPVSPFHGRIDADRIGLAGHSLGAWTSILAGGADPDYTDPRARAIVALSGPSNEFVYEPGELGKIRVPILFMFGEKEAAGGRQSDLQFLYEPANAPKFLLEIAGADHLTFAGMVAREYSSVGNYLAHDPRRRAIVEYTGAFLDWYLAEIPEAKQVLLSLSPQIVSYVGDFAGE